MVVPNWDNTPRRGWRGEVVADSTPELFCQMVEKAVSKVQDRDIEDRLIIVKSWNEWAEGNYLEPDSRFGTQYLEAISEVIFK